MIVLGPLDLFAVGALAVSGITAGTVLTPCSSRPAGLSPARPGERAVLPLFLGLVLAAAAMSGLARIVTGLGRGVSRFDENRTGWDNAERGHQPEGR